MTQTITCTFEQGYDRLTSIIGHLDNDTVSLDETVELLREAKGLEQALRTYLQASERQLEEIGAGANLPDFAIVATTPRRPSPNANPA